MNKVPAFLALLACAAVAGACGTSSSPSVTSPSGVADASMGTDAMPGFAAAARPGSFTIVEIAAGDERFDLLVAAVVHAGLADTLSGRGQFTVFAPSDDAFLAFLGLADEGAAAAAISGLDPEVVQGILLYHVTNGRRTSNSVLKAAGYQMLNGQRLTQATLLDAGILQANVSASNGIIHVVGAVLQP